MKKAVLKLKSGSGTILAFLVLAFVFASIAAVVYIVISQSPGKTPHAALIPSNYAPVTQMVYPYQDSAFFNVSVDATGVSGRKGSCNVAGSSFSCSMGFLTFVANEPIGYTVTFKDTGGSGTNFTKTGQTNAKADGSADIRWSLDYTIRAWPGTKGSCAGAGSLCKVTNINGVNTWGNTTTFTGLEISTGYSVSTCIYNCSSTTPFASGGGFLTGGASLGNNGVPSMVCSNTLVDTTFGWKNIDMADIEVWLDYSIYNNNFATDSYSSTLSGRYNSAPFGRNVTYKVPSLPANTNYYWRVRTLDKSWTNDIWMYSQTGTFKTINCSFSTPTPTPILSPTPSPLSVDIDGDGCIDSKELGTNWRYGGQRDPNNKWDFFDVPTPAITAANANLPLGAPGRPTLNKVINIQDVIALQIYVGTAKGRLLPNAYGVTYDTHYGYQLGLTSDPNFTDGMFYDRTPSTDTTQPWRSGPPSGAVNINDVTIAQQQVGTSCQ